MKKIMIDMDDVICDKGYLNIVNDFLDTNYKIEDLKEYYIQDLVPKEKRDEYSKFFYEKNVYDYAEIIPGAYDIMKKLQEKYEIYITTTYIFKDYPKMSANNLKNKFNYLVKEFPYIKPEQYIFTSNKELINCDIKIDDKINNLEGNAQTKLLFSAYHNRKITDNELKQKGIIRVNSWYEIEKILL